MQRAGRPGPIYRSVPVRCIAWQRSCCLKLAAEIQAAEQEALILRYKLVSLGFTWLSVPNSGQRPEPFPLTIAQRGVLNNPPANTQSHNTPELSKRWRDYHNALLTDAGAEFEGGRDA